MAIRTHHFEQQQVELRDLEDFTFEHHFASDSAVRKVLLIVVKGQRVFYRIKHRGEIVYATSSMSDALVTYNNVQ